MVPVSRFPDATTTRKLLANRYFWSRVLWMFEDEFAFRGERLDADFKTYCEAIRPYTRVSHPFEDDPDIELRLVSAALHLPDGYLWEVELYDNGEDAGTNYYLHDPSLPERLELAVHDAHSNASCQSIGRASGIGRARS